MVEKEAPHRTQMPPNWYRPAKPPIPPLHPVSIRMAAQTISTLFNRYKPPRRYPHRHEPPSHEVYFVLHDDGMYIKYHYTPLQMGLRMRIPHPTPLKVPEALKYLHPLPILMRVDVEAFLSLPALHNKPLQMKIHAPKDRYPYLQLDCDNWEQTAYLRDDKITFLANEGPLALTLSVVNYSSSPLPTPPELHPTQKASLKQIGDILSIYKWNYVTQSPENPRLTTLMAQPAFNTINNPLPAGTGMFITLKNKIDT